MSSLPAELSLRVTVADHKDLLRFCTQDLVGPGLQVDSPHRFSVGETVSLVITCTALVAPLVLTTVVTESSDGPTGRFTRVRVPADRPQELEHLRTVLATLRPPGPSDRLPQFTVLLVDDNPHIIHMYGHALRRVFGGHEATIVVESAITGLDALQRLDRPPQVDLVITDIGMPVLDGFQLLTRMRASEQHRKLPVVVVSASQDAEERARHIGVDAFLHKPITLQDLVSHVRAVLGRPRGMG